MDGKKADTTEVPHPPGKAAFLAMPHEIRASALVGCFMQWWAAMEAGLDDAMAKALALTPSQKFIVSPNVNFAAKANILKAAIGLTRSHNFDAPFGRNARKRFTKTVNEISGALGVRNMVAHYMFSASEKNDGVRFVVFQARGELKFPEEEWPIQRFLEYFSKLQRWDAELKALEEWLEPERQGALELLSSLYAMGYGPYDAP